jgi:hypothetical protein
MCSQFNLISMPNDVQARGYRETRPYHYEQVFVSPSSGFVGTEREFVKAGLAHAYVQIDNHTRRQVAA